MATTCILVGVDFSDLTTAVLAEARRLARAFDAKLYLVHVDVAVSAPDFIGYDVGPAFMRTEIAQQIRDEHRDIQTLERQLQAEGLDATALLVAGDPAEKLADQAARLQPLFIVLGSHAHGQLYRLLAGSVRDGVLKHVHCPVVIVPNPAAASAETASDPTSELDAAS